MDKTFLNFSKKIKYDITSAFNDAKLLKAKSIDDKTFEVFLELYNFAPVDEMLDFLIAIKKNIKYKTTLYFDIKNPNININIVYDYIQLFWIKFLKVSWSPKHFLKKNFRLEGDEVMIFLNTSKEEMYIKNTQKDLRKLLKLFGFGNMNISAKLIIKKDDVLNKAKKSYYKQIEYQIKNLPQPIKEVFIPKDKKPQLFSIKECKNMQDRSVIIKGEIFNRELKKIKNNLYILKLSIIDYQDAINIVFFINEEKKFKYDDLQLGKWVRVKGKVALSKFIKNEYEVKATSLDKTTPNRVKRYDNAKEKRVELNTRTIMSTMDGIASPKDLINKAISFGHSSIAVVDSESSVQSFPDFYKNAGNLKIIYGSSFNMIHKYPKIVNNPNDGLLDKKTYVVFDLETTGLSPIYNDIIEFGAIKIKEGKIIDEKQIFIKNTRPLTKSIKELTNITEEMLLDAPSEEEALKEILNYFGDTVLVAHNAAFDMGFIHEKIYKYNLPKINPIVIDTWTASQFQYPNQKRFSLKNIAKKNGCLYDSDISHRAKYDANVLANVWISMIAKFKRDGINTLIKLSKCVNNNHYLKAFSKEVSIIAKNNIGIKELFRLVSLAHTKQYYNSPKLFWEELPKSENLLIGSGGIKSELVNKMLTGTTLSIKTEIKRYDYIEIQPLRNYSHHIDRGNISKKQLINIIKIIINEAKKNNILVVATGDVRYLDDYDAIYHSVYINAKGLGGKRHYLFKKDDDSHVSYPVQSYLTTEEMIKAFDFLDSELAKEIVITNTNIIANKIEVCEITKKKLYTPKIENSDKILANIVWNTAKEKYGQKLPNIIEKRIEKELSNIVKYGFSVIYYIAHKLVSKSLKDGYLVGSRGSVGSSIVATLSGITEVNPLPPHYICVKCKYSEFYCVGEYKSGYDLPNKKCPKCNNLLFKDGHDIPFETFLGFRANKIPDIDLNFSSDYQSIIHDEVKKFFGDKNIFRAGTISTVAEKTAFGYVKTWAEETGKQISKSFIEFMVKNITGTKRTTGQHPGGIIVIPEQYDVEDFSPVNYPANDTNSAWKTTHFDFHAIHNNVLKLDLLGHDDPTAIKMLERLTGFIATEIPNYDKKVLSLFSTTKALKIQPEQISGETIGVMGIPEFGTKFVRKMLKLVQVNSFSDLVSISGLSHGTDVWTNNGELLIKNEGKSISDLISCRDDIMIDLTNKGMNALEAFIIMEQVRKGESITKEQEKRMKDVNVEDWYIDSCKKIKYMFPKAHATAYVKMAWRIAWFKLYYPLAYYATYLTTRADFSDILTLSSGPKRISEVLLELKSRIYKQGEWALTNKEKNLIPILEIAQELFARGYKIQNINIKKSLANEWVISEDKKSIIPPFSTIDCFGPAVSKTIINARNKKQFSSIEDLRTRSSINKTNIEKLKKLGVLKDLEETNQLTFF